MFIPHEGPGTWQSFLKRKDNVGLTIMEMRQKYLKEQLLFESYFQTLNTTSTVSTAAAGAAGGPAPSTGGGGIGGPTISFKINTNYNPTVRWGNIADAPTTQIDFNFSPCELSSAYPQIGTSDQWNGDVMIDWGDGTVETYTGYTDFLLNGRYGVVRHNYASDGEYTVTISGPGSYWLRWIQVPVIEFIEYDYTQIPSYKSLFALFPLQASQNFVTDISDWVIPQGTSLENFAGGNGTAFGFYNNYSNAVTQYGFTLDISNWDVSGVTSLKNAFGSIMNFNGSQIANWAPSSTLENLYATFYQTTGQYNYPNFIWGGTDLSTLDLSNWDTSGVSTWNQFMAQSNWGGLGANSLDFSNIANINSTNRAFDLVTFAESEPTTPYQTGSLPAVPDWNYGGNTSETGIYFPGVNAVTGPGSDGWFSYRLMMSKADFGTTLIGWANNPDMTINSAMNIAYSQDPGLKDFDYSGDANVVAALTTLQNTKGWTIVGITF